MGTGESTLSSFLAVVRDALEKSVEFYNVLEPDSRRDPSVFSDDYDQIDFFPAKKPLFITHTEKAKQVVTAPVKALKRLQWTPKRVKLRDKATFALGVAQSVLSAFWLGRSPSTFYQLYTAKAVFLFGLRAYLYKKDKMHYYMLDFCYYANLLTILHIWMFPSSCAQEKIMFAFSMGPLAWSILAFRNSMIFHSLDKMTSLFVHAFPPLVAWATRWYPADPGIWNTRTGCMDKEATVRELIFVPWVPYALWAIFYYLKLFVISSEHIQQQEYHTLFKYLTRNPKSYFGKMAATVPRQLAPLIFMCWHVVFCAVTFTFSWLMWQHFWLNTIFVAAMLFISAWNGGNYYFEVFAYRYLNELATKVGSKDLDQREGKGSETEKRTGSAMEGGVVQPSKNNMQTAEGASDSGEAAGWEVLDGSDVQPRQSAEESLSGDLLHGGRLHADGATDEQDLRKRDPPSTVPE